MRLIGTSMVLLAMACPVLGQQPSPAPNPNFDQSGKGAVLCTWTVFQSLQNMRSLCKWEHKPVDDAIDEAMVKIDQFIIANSSQRPTRASLDQAKATNRERELKQYERLNPARACATLDKVFRSVSVQTVQDSVSDLLSVPREPVMSPCL